MTDAYAGYERAENVTRALCFAHVRRYWSESIPLDSEGKEIPGSMGAIGHKRCDNLFRIEREIKHLTPEKRLAERKRRSKPESEAYYAWGNEISTKITTNEKLTKAITYSLNQRKYLGIFLENEQIPISNNWNESKLHNYAVARQAWLFADSPYPNKGTNKHFRAYD